MQEELFKEARYKLEKNQSVVNSNILVHEEKIESMAKGMAELYISSKEYLGEFYDQVITVYRILCAPEEFLFAKYFSNKENATSTYRQLAKMLHPDKNRHHLSSEAFLKVSNLFSSANTN